MPGPALADDKKAPESGDFILKNRDLVIQDAKGRERVRIDASTGAIRLRIATSGSPIVFLLDPEQGNMTLGGHGRDGDLMIMPSSADGMAPAEATIRLHGDEADVKIGNAKISGFVQVSGPQNQFAVLTGEGSMRVSGRVNIEDAKGEAIIQLNSAGRALIGGAGADGEIFIRDGRGERRIMIDGGSASIQVGGAGAGAKLILRDDGGEQRILLDGEHAAAQIGGNGRNGSLTLHAAGAGDKASPRSSRIHAEAEGARLWVGGNGADGDIMLFASDVDRSAIADVAELTERASIHLNGQDGDIVLRNADCAEEFDVAPGHEIVPGVVVVIGEHNRIEPCARAYDRRVVGVVSGAGGFRPGLLLDRKQGADPRMPVALMGKVGCWVDASHGAIEAGDLLTASPTIGHAMRVADPQRAIGAVIGKALGACREGRAVISILATLQ